MDTPAYEFRPSIRKDDHRFTLTKSGINLDTSRGDRKVVSYREVAAVNLAMVGQGKYRLLLKSDAGTKISVMSHSYVSLGNFESRMGEFVPLVEALLASVEPYRDRIRLTLGVPLAYYSVVVCIALVPVLLLGVIVGMVVTGDPPPRRVLGRMALALMVTFGLGYPIARKGRPKALPPESDEWRTYLPRP